MDKKALIEKIFAEGKKHNISDMEVYTDGASNLTLKVFQSELEGYSLSETDGLSFRGIYNGKMGYSYTEKVDETSIDMLIKDAIENSQILDSDDTETIYEGSKEYQDVNTYNHSLEKVSELDKINFTKTTTEKALKIDKRITAVECHYGDGFGQSIMSNTKGLYLEQKSNITYAFLEVVAKDGDSIKDGFSYVAGRDFSKFDPEKLAKEAVEEAISMLGAKSIEPENYTIILRNNAAVDLLEAFSGVFSAENVQKNLSLLKGKLNEKIGSEKFTLIDDPFMEDGLSSRSFDGEGAACKYKKVIDKGVLKTYLHNLKTAKKDNVETTGNASKASFKSPIDISPSNFYVESGNKTLEEMIKDIDSGVMITSLQGLHSGLNAVSGDFSLSASGYEIEKGKLKRPVEQITIAGSFFEMLQNIEEVGNDIKFGLPSEAYIGSPSLKIKSLAIAGE